MESTPKPGEHSVRTHVPTNMVLHGQDVGDAGVGAKVGMGVGESRASVPLYPPTAPQAERAANKGSDATGSTGR